MTRIIAVDWSGARTGERSKIWLAEVVGRELVRLESGRSREELIQDLIVESGREPEMIVGFDFAFSLPRWFLEERKMTAVEALWDEVSQFGEDWLARCDAPFWGRPGKTKPEIDGHFRRTELDANVAGIGAKSVFQVGGAGAVGTGSIRGMPYLASLRNASFSVWPFHEVRLPLIVEIYPRRLTGPVIKSSPSDRARYLESGFPELRPRDVTTAASTEDAFDAAVSAVIMARHGDELMRLERATDPVELLEGRIWSPVPTGHPGAHRESQASVGLPHEPPVVLAAPMSPTIFRAKGLRFHFFSREEERMHVHVLGQEGEAKFWMEPEIEVAAGGRLSEKTLRVALELIREHEDEIRRAWRYHFGR